MILENSDKEKWHANRFLICIISALNGEDHQYDHHNNCHSFDKINTYYRLNSEHYDWLINLPGVVLDVYSFQNIIFKHAHLLNMTYKKKIK